MTQTIDKQPMPLEDFVQTMEKMREHYKSGKSTRYPLGLATIYDALQTEVPNSAVEVVGECEQKTVDLIEHERVLVTQDSEKFLKNYNFADFKAEMDKRREKMKKDANRIIDSTVDSLIDRGEKHPEARESILKLTDNIWSFITGIYNKVKDFIVELVNKIRTWVTTVISKVKGFFSGLINTSKSFFGGLFGKNSTVYPPSMN